MRYSILHFLIAIILAIICARTLGLSNHDIPLIAMIIPALWLLPRQGASGVILLLSMGAYGVTLSEQPAYISISVWVLFPMLMVAFSSRSNLAVVVCCALIAIALETGVMVSQSSGKLNGTPWLTTVQLVSVMLMWWAARSWKAQKHHSWWVLCLVIPMYMSGLEYAALLSLTFVGIIASLESLHVALDEEEFCWHSLLCWTLPSVGFVTFVLSPDLEMPSAVFVVWMCLLVTAWMTDYILRSNEDEQQWDP
ncbi:hypothetical protein [Vibrio palustris]|uniref:Integral membrane protein n=1 Tax=Vibrio palustris TaxID=1918946 RepID=A0A1R4B3E6_9VIBR|nr:hypothetical protein [Vibrio palustris]SJL83423.1 hypothetical protein VPAL9027_01391 [Vibrio palustris]